MEGCTNTGLYGALLKVLPTIYKLVKEYKRHSANYTALVHSNQYTKREDEDIEVKYIWISMNNILSKLHKYQELLLQSPAYAAMITINLIFCWQ